MWEVLAAAIVQEHEKTEKPMLDKMFGEGRWVYHAACPRSPKHGAWHHEECCA